MQDSFQSKTKLSIPSSLPNSQLSKFKVHGLQPRIAASPKTSEEMSEIISIAQKSNWGVAPFGSGTKQEKKTCAETGFWHAAGKPQKRKAPAGPPGFGNRSESVRPALRPYGLSSVGAGAQQSAFDQARIPRTNPPLS